jgi:protein-S-isoprenylcysteine O-methyltransferase Ste14
VAHPECWRGLGAVATYHSGVRSIPSLGSRGEGWVALQLGAIALVAIAGRVDAAPTSVDPSLAMALRAAGLGLLVFAGLLILSGSFVLRSAGAFSVLPRPISGGEFVASGPYRIVRHPVYAGLILGGLGIALDRLSVSTLLATLLLAIILDLKRRREEQWLVERFPGYGAYRERTKAFVPFVY